MREGALTLTCFDGESSDVSDFDQIVSFSESIFRFHVQHRSFASPGIDLDSSISYNRRYAFTPSHVEINGTKTNSFYFQSA